MKHIFAAITAALALAGCNSVPDQVDNTIVVSGQYQALAECSWRKSRYAFFARNYIPAPHRDVVRIEFGTDVYQLGYAEFAPEAGDRTRVEFAYTHILANNRILWPKFEKIVRACAAE